MKIIVFFVIAILIDASHQQSCNSTTCLPPNCRCMSASPPGNLDVKDTPQLVFISIDSAIQLNALTNYTSIMSGRTNPNNCPVSMTYFVNHDYNNYNLTNYMYSLGHEVASHTLSASTTFQNDWAESNVSTWKAEIGGMRDAIVNFANIPSNLVKGFRAPYLQTNGDATMQALASLSLSYDASYPTTTYTSPPIYPYTLDYGLQHDCVVGNCPTAKYPGLWTLPIVALTDKTGNKCSYAGACSPLLSRNDTFSYFYDNFQRHYTSSKAPFSLAFNANSFFSSGYTLDGFLDFLNYLHTLPDVYITSLSKGLDWLKNPVPLSQAATGVLGCPSALPQRCSKRSACSYDYGSSLFGYRIMPVCGTCPDVYPWTCNPLGKDPAPSTC